jgi:O-antigen/teichoic acid export membrane protein
MSNIVNKQILSGSIIAYLNIIINLIINFLLTPFILKHLGISEYGVYKIVQSFIGQLAIMSFGISTVTARYIVVYNTLNKTREKCNFLFIIYSISIILSLSVITVGMILYSFMDNIYSKSLATSELYIAKILCVILIFNISLSILSDTYSGVIRAYEKFIVSNLVVTIKLIIRMITIIILLKLNCKAVSIVLTDLIITITILLFNIIYVKIELHESAKFYIFDKKLILEVFTFSFAVLLQAIVNQVNQNLDNTILGIMTDTKTVSIYSIGLMLYTCFINLVTAISSMFAPKATKLVTNNATKQELTDFVCCPGRIQTIIALLGILGFTVVGRDFIHLWMGDNFKDVYIITLILIIPAIIPLIESVTNNILDAMLKRMTRSIILIFMCIINIFLSIIFIKKIGYIGAAFGTALSVIIGHGIIINIYLQRKIGLNIPLIFNKVFNGILSAFVISIVLSIIISFIPGEKIIYFIIKEFMVIIEHSNMMYLFGLNESEKVYIRNLIKKYY